MKPLSFAQKKLYAELWKKVNIQSPKEETAVAAEAPIELPLEKPVVVLGKVFEMPNGQEEAIKCSVKIIQALEHIRAVNNKDVLKKKMSVNRLIEVYKVNAHHHGKLEELNKTCHQWALACVMAFVSSRQRKDLSPLEEDFQKADAAIKEFQLNFSFNDIEDLYLSPRSSENIMKLWF